VIAYYLYLGFLKAKDWILSTFDMLYEYFQELFSVLQEVYEFVITIPEVVADFFEDIVSKLVGGGQLIGLMILEICSPFNKNFPSYFV
jgi:hypothetical protein